MSSGVRLTGNYEVESVSAIKIPSGTDAQRPATPSQGDMRFNTTSLVLEIYDGGTWNVPTGGGGVTVSSITNVTTTNPVRVTTASAHNLIDGNAINITGIVGTTELNGNNYYVDVISGDTIDLYTDSSLSTSVAGAGYTPYVSGGIIVPGSSTPSLLQLTDTPSTYSGAGKYLKVNNSNNGIEFDSLTTDDVIEGSSNKFFSGKTTDDLPQGLGNLYLDSTNLATFSIDSLQDVKTTGSGHVPTDGQALVWDQSMGHWMPGTVSGGGGGGTPGGSSGQVQFNSAGSFAADADFTYNSSTDTLSVQNLNLTGNFTNTASGTPTVLSANDLVLQSDTSTGEIRLVGSNVKLTDSPLQFKAYTAAQLNAISVPMLGQISYVSDGLLGQPGIAVYTGSSWEYIKPGVTGGSSISSISAATATNPVAITTSSAHGLNNGQKLTITDVVGMIELNGNSYYANVTSSTAFTLYSDTGLTTTVDGTAFTPYVSGGDVAGQFEVISPSGLQNIVEDTTPQLGGPLELNGHDLITGQNRITFAPSGGSAVSYMDFTNVQFGQNNNTVLSSVKSINFFLDSNGGDSGQAFRLYNNVDPDNLGTTAESDYIFKVSENGDVHVKGNLTVDGTGGGGGGGTSYDQSLNTTDSVTFASVTTDSLVTSTSGTPTIASASNIVLQPTGSVIVQTGGFRLANLDTTARNALTASNGEMIYNTTVNKIQAYQNGAWINIDDGSAA